MPLWRYFAPVPIEWLSIFPLQWHNILFVGLKTRSLSIVLDRILQFLTPFQVSACVLACGGRCILPLVRLAVHQSMHTKSAST